jgi:hypothetical protein
MKGWREAIVAARALGLPYEEARAHLEVSRHLPPDDRRRRAHLDRARMLFEQLGCGDALSGVEAEPMPRAVERRRP